MPYLCKIKMPKQCSWLCGGQEYDSNRGKRVLNLHFSRNDMYYLLIDECFWFVSFPARSSQEQDHCQSLILLLLLTISRTVHKASAVSVPQPCAMGSVSPSRSDLEKRQTQISVLRKDNSFNLTEIKHFIQPPPEGSDFMELTT